jgi:hypothetical protein
MPAAARCSCLGFLIARDSKKPFRFFCPDFKKAFFVDLDNFALPDNDLFPFQGFALYALLAVALRGAIGLDGGLVIAGR